MITDGRHAAIDMRLVWPASGDEPENKLNRLIANVHRIWEETAEDRYTRPDGSPYPIPGAGQLIFSDLGTISVEAKRGFSAYRWIKQELVRRGVPASEIAYMQDFKKSADKQRLFNDFNAGRVRVLIGSSETMGTGVNVQQRLQALHHLDVPWLPSQIEQREGRIERQGNQHDEIGLYAYATLGSMDATMWQNNERKARFIAAALSGDRSVRRVEDIGSQVNQFAMAKAIASGDSRLMQKAGLENEIARLQRQRAAHIDDQHEIRRRIHTARHDRQQAETRIEAIRQDLARRVPTRGDAFAMEVAGRTFTERKVAGASLLSKVRMAALERDTRDWTIGRIGGFDLTCGVWRDLAGPGCSAQLDAGTHRPRAGRRGAGRPDGARPDRAPRIRARPLRSRARGADAPPGRRQRLPRGLRAPARRDVPAARRTGRKAGEDGRARSRSGEDGKHHRPDDEPERPEPGQKPPRQPAMRRVRA